MTTEPDVLIVPTPTQSFEQLLAQHESPAERARNVLRRVFMEPSLYPALVHEITKEICAAEQFLIKGSVAIVRETFGREPR